MQLKRETFEFKEVSILDVVKTLNTLGNGGSFGHDSLDAISIKAVAPSIIKPLHHIVNLSLTESSFANRWRIGRVIPLHKGKRLDRKSSSSYRPISLLPLVSKIVEKTAQKQILEFMEKSKQFNSNNNAYRKYYNTATAIIQISDAIHQAADEKTIANILTIDESAAFDTISHEILQQKLKLYNFGPKARLWMKNYMSFRSQYVSIGNSNSTMKAVKHGVPQGSVIGPLIYTIYINEMPAILEDTENCEEVTHLEVHESLFPVNCKKVWH